MIGGLAFPTFTLHYYLVSSLSAERYYFLEAPALGYEPYVTRIPLKSHHIFITGTFSISVDSLYNQE